MRKTPIRPGTLILATANRIEDYGVFFEYDGITVLVLITEMTNGFVGHPSDLVSVGEQVHLKILRYNEEKGRYVATMVV